MASNQLFYYNGSKIRSKTHPSNQKKYLICFKCYSTKLVQRFTLKKPKHNTDFTIDEPVIKLVKNLKDKKPKKRN